MLGIHISSITRRKTKRSTFHVRDLLCNKTIKRFVRGAHGEVETESQSRIEKERERERERERENRIISRVNPTLLLESNH